MNRSFATIAVLAAALLLSGCPNPQRAVPTTVDRAGKAMRSGNPAGAAALYEQAAEQTSNTADRVEFRLIAARAWLAAGRPADADRVLASIGAGATQQQALEQHLLRIESVSAQGRGDDAWREISGMTPPAAPAAAAQYFATRQQVAITTGHLVDGIRAEQSRERLVGPGPVAVTLEHTPSEVCGDGHALQILGGERSLVVRCDEPVVGLSP